MQHNHAAFRRLGLLTPAGGGSTTLISKGAAGALTPAKFSQGAAGAAPSPRGFTPPVSQIRPSGVTICMGSPHATQETLDVRGVGSNHNPGVFSNLSWAFWPDLCSSVSP